MFIDIHSHRHVLNTDHWVIKNLYEHFEKEKKSGKYSIGLHPWFIKADNWGKQFEILEQFSTNSFVVAIGECGLDKNCATDFTLQKDVFNAHINLANFLKKPLIIHCVNAYEEVKQLLKIHNNKVPVIFHGFNKNEHIAQLLVKQGFFLSFGKVLFKESILAVIKKIPPENIFFETDDADISIEKIYSKAAEILSIEIEKLQIQIKKNAIKLFGDGLIKR